MALVFPNYKEIPIKFSFFDFSRRERTWVAVVSTGTRVRVTGRCAQNACRRRNRRYDL